MGPLTETRAVPAASSREGGARGKRATSIALAVGALVAAWASGPAQADFVLPDTPANRSRGVVGCIQRSGGIDCSGRSAGASSQSGGSSPSRSTSSSPSSREEDLRRQMEAESIRKRQSEAARKRLDYPDVQSDLSRAEARARRQKDEAANIEAIRRLRNLREGAPRDAGAPGLVRFPEPPPPPPAALIWNAALRTPVQDAAVLANDSYFTNDFGYKAPDGYTLVLPPFNGGNGFRAAAYRKNETGEIFIAFRGSEPFDYRPGYGGDIDTWLPIFKQDSSPYGLKAQIAQARAFTDRVLAQNPDSKVVITGHSLGGALAQIEAARTGHRGETFNAPGMAGVIAELNPGGRTDFSNITNHRREGDLVSKVGVAAGNTVVYSDPPGTQEAGRVVKELETCRDRIGCRVMGGIAAGSAALTNHSMDLFQRDLNDRTSQAYRKLTEGPREKPLPPLESQAPAPARSPLAKAAAGHWPETATALFPVSTLAEKGALAAAPMGMKAAEWTGKLVADVRERAKTDAPAALGEKAGEWLAAKVPGGTTVKSLLDKGQETYQGYSKAVVDLYQHGMGGAETAVRTLASPTGDAGALERSMSRATEDAAGRTQAMSRDLSRKFVGWGTDGGLFDTPRRPDSPSASAIVPITGVGQHPDQERWSFANRN
jgi:hypothetical protein